MDNNSMAIRKLKFHMAGRNPQIVPCLVGPTGIGKTAIVNRVAKDLGAELVYFNMAQQNQGDNALPVPHINNQQTLVQYALHHKFQEILDNPQNKYIVMCDEYFNKDDIFIIFTTFEKDNFAAYLLPEPVFLDGVCVDPYAPNITVLAATRGETLINDHMVVKNWFTGQLAEGLIKAQTLDENAI